MTHSKTLCAVLFSASLGCVWAGTAQADPTTVSTVSYNVAPGACSAAIAVPVNNKPVLMMGSMIIYPFPGNGSVTLFRGNTQNILVWAGVDFATGTEKSYSYSAGAHIMSLDYNGHVDVQTAGSSHIKVCADASSDVPHAAGYLTFAY